MPETFAKHVSCLLLDIFVLMKQGPPGPQGDRGQAGPRGSMVSRVLFT